MTTIASFSNLTPLYSEKAALEAIAMQCPLLDGNAVYRARSLLSIVTGTLSSYDDSTACVGNEAFFAPPPSSSFTYHEQNLLAFPNPAAHTVTFSWGQILEQPGEIRLYDLYGRQVRLTTTATNISNYTMRVADLPGGVYFYKASLNSRNFAGKLVIKH
ncbi:MAG: T9SS type A sorting domain-containing protein [Saprospiraceae bacterium]|nr:T9SS type A sorting domain-containing protein [Saprospiraceae bacterium]